MRLEKRPNIIFVITDDQGYGDLGCTGNPIIRTPNIDKFYKESIHLTNYHVGPTCAPTRSGIMTGHYANSTGVWHTIGGRSLLRKDEWTLASALAENGYKTGIFGKWHLGDESPYRPEERGFQTSITHGGGAVGNTPDYWGNDYFDDTYFVNGNPKKFKGYCTDVWFTEALSFIKKTKDEKNPFFCYIPTNAPHGPFNVEDKYSSLYKDSLSEKRAHFYGMITNIDKNFGILMTKIKEWDLEDNTILIFTTDNGTSTGVNTDKNGFVTDGYNVGMRGKKGSEYEGGHRVPFFIRWPQGKFNISKEIDELTANIDLMPTLLDLCNISIDEHSFHGKSIVPLFYNSNSWKERVLVTDSQRVANPIKWKQSAVMSNRWRLINGRELYDIHNDPGQVNNLALQYPEIVSKLRDEYEKWWQLVSVKFENEIPITFNNNTKNCLTCHDWRNNDASSPYHQGFIRLGMQDNGYWEIEVEDSGEYEIELRRWPKETGYKLCDGINRNDIKWEKRYILKEYWYMYTDGKAIPIKTASLKIGEQEYSMDINRDNLYARFNIKLEKGSYHLQTWFTTEENYKIGAYYVYVSPVLVDN